MSKNSETSRQPMSFAHALGLLFIGLKLSKIIKWRWMWVVAPLWAPIILTPALRKVNEWAIEAGEKQTPMQQPYEEPLDPNF